MNPSNSLPAEQKCPNCGEMNENQSRFCTRGGAILALDSAKTNTHSLIQVILILLAMGFGASGACFLGFGVFGWDNRDIGFAPSLKMASGGLVLLVVAAVFVWMLLRLTKPK